MIPTILKRSGVLVSALVFGSIYSILVYLGVDRASDWLVQMDIQPFWLGVSKILGFFIAFLALIYPLYFIGLIERHFRGSAMTPNTEINKQNKPHMAPPRKHFD